MSTGKEGEYMARSPRSGSGTVRETLIDQSGWLISYNVVSELGIEVGIGVVGYVKWEAKW